MPYITASIILQLLTVVYEPLAKLQKEGELGRKKITQWTRYLTVILSAVQSFGIAISLQKAAISSTIRAGLHPDDHADPDHGQRLHHVAGRADHRARHRQRHVAADLCRHRGRTAARRHRSLREGQTNAWGVFTVPGILMLLVLMVAVVAFIVYVERSERRIPVQYAKRVVGRKVMGGQSTHLPLRVNAGGVMPVIFASSILDLAADAGCGLKQQPVSVRFSTLKWGEPLYTLLYAVGIIFFAYFYVSRSCSTRTRSRTTCGSMADSFPASVPASAPPTSSTMCSPASRWWARST
jgi:preprotein translocase subunit SecY